MLVPIIAKNHEADKTSFDDVREFEKKNAPRDPGIPLSDKSSINAS